MWGQVDILAHMIEVFSQFNTWRMKVKNLTKSKIKVFQINGGVDFKKLENSKDM